MNDCDRNKAITLLKKHTKNSNLLKHMLAVESAMRIYAKKFNKNPDWWGVVGLLHDFDYEKYPDPKDHPAKGAEILRHEGYSDEFIKTILAHASHAGEPRDTLAKKTIFAVDELCGFVIAVTLVRPNKSLSEVKVKSVKKKMKDKAFARQVNRDEIIKGAEELNVPLDEHIGNVLTALQSISQELNL
ncbi:HDIG domain-containing protein [Patescibacteria group bacterium]|nr:HDIG domain-containing protein [Patescibacteria group bacterium]MBU0964368.1 HDIG domain-containing protein [Patescibacteria group bacterium]